MAGNPMNNPDATSTYHDDPNDLDDLIILPDLDDLDLDLDLDLDHATGENSKMFKITLQPNALRIERANDGTVLVQRFQSHSRAMRAYRDLESDLMIVQTALDDPTPKRYEEARQIDDAFRVIGRLDRTLDRLNRMHTSAK